MNTDRTGIVMKRNSLEDTIRILGLQPLTGEGGMWSQPYSSDENVKAGDFEGRDTDRPICSTIHYLLTPASFSCMHRLVTDEIWYHHSGPALRMLLIHDDGSCEVRLLGQDLLNDELPQISVPRGTWQGAQIDRASLEGCGPDEEVFTLVSTSMAPAYQDEDFTAGTFEELRDYVPDDDPEMLELLRALTSEPVYL